MNATAATLRTTRTSEFGPRTLAGLLIPADPAVAVRLVAVADASVAISDLLGSVLLDDVIHWTSPKQVRVSIYLGEDRAAAPDNPRLSLLTTRLGLTDRAFHATARGDALILGASASGTDVDLSCAVIAEVARCGITGENSQGGLLVALAGGLPRPSSVR